MIKRFRQAVLRVIIFSTLCGNAFSATEDDEEVISFLGKSTGQFINPTGQRYMDTTGTGTDDFTWGKKSRLGNSNRVKYKGAGFVTHIDEVFIVGSLVYANGDTLKGTNATTVDLNIILKFEDGSIVPFPVPMELISTPNGRSHHENADILRIYSNKYNNLFNLNGQTYMLELSFGEATSDGFTSVDQFHVFEGFAASAELLARIKEHHFDSPLLGRRPGTTPEPYPIRTAAYKPRKAKGKPIGTGGGDYLTEGEFSVKHAVEFGFKTETGKVYQPQISMDNRSWSDWGPSAVGDGSYKTVYKTIDDANIPRYRIKVTRR